ncbi:ABC transporter substrate-binding protein [Ruminiclostridium cellobioparum]|uniref:ABC transporter substrate-binding protein n=1 Tax=Ruminiclostridium cellobioparum TaxID=29355 RepID=UPI00048574C3|nr:ABC transporter substrate-binding protein [Ruminiclostridium cellobioparum]
MKRVIAFLMVSMLVLGLFAGCGNSNGTASSSTGPQSSGGSAASEVSTPAAPAEKAKVTLWYYWENKDHQQILTDIVKQYNTSQNEVEVTNEYYPFADFKKVLSIGLAASKLPDLVLIDNPDHAAYAAMGLFADITDKIKDWPDKEQYFEGPWKSCTLNGKVYGIPFGSNDLALYYNEDMLNKAGVKPPQTWDELRAAAKKLTGNGVTGLGVSAPKTEEGTFQFMPWILSAGGDLTKIDSPEGIKSFTMISDLVKDGSMSKEVMNWVQSDVLKQFIAGKIAMMFNGPWQVPTLKKDAPDLKWNVTLIPKDKQYASVLGGENWGVVNGKNVDATVKFLKYVTQVDVLKGYIGKFGYFPSRKDLASDPQFTGDPIYKVFIDELQYAQPRGPHPKWPELSNAVSQALQEVIAGVKTPEAAAKDAQEKIDKAIK